MKVIPRGGHNGNATGNKFPCVKKQERKPRMHQWRLLYSGQFMVSLAMEYIHREKNIYACAFTAWERDSHTNLPFLMLIFACYLTYFQINPRLRLWLLFNITILYMHLCTLNTSFLGCQANIQLLTSIYKWFSICYHVVVGLVMPSKQFRTLYPSLLAYLVQKECVFTFCKRLSLSLGKLSCIAQMSERKIVTQLHRVQSLPLASQRFFCQGYGILNPFTQCTEREAVTQPIVIRYDSV